MSPAKFNTITAIINGANKKLWKHTEEQWIFEGWKIVNGENYVQQMNYINTLLIIKLIQLLIITKLIVN